MNALLAETVEAQLGRPLQQVPGTSQPAQPPVELTVTECHDLIDLWCQLLTDVYVHYNQKTALYGYDPIRGLLALKRQIPFLDSAGFLRQLTLLINRLRDQHTQLYLPGTPDRRPWVATLPFLVETYGEYRSPTYVVTKVSKLLNDPTFVEGVHLDTWNGVPFWRALDLYADTLTGGRPDARRARALETITQRPLAYLPQPDELWVDIGYHHPTAPDPALKSTRFEWNAIDPALSLTAPTTIELRT